MNAAANLLGVNGGEACGPRGGNLNNPKQNGAARRAPLNAPVDPATGLPGLHGYKDTATAGWIKEPPWARMAAFMLLQGRTNSEIAMAGNVEVNAVANMRAQRWFQELLATLANEEGEACLGLLRAEAVASVQTVVELRDSAENDRVRLSAATFIIEQVQGKAVQRNMNINASTSILPPDEEMTRITEELSILRAVRQTPQAPSEPETPTS